MNDLALLTWARGPALALALAICLGGILLRLFEILALGRKADLAPARATSPGSGWRTVFSRFLPVPGMLRLAPLTYLGGYVFHVGWAVALLCFVPHIELVRSVLGIGWPGLPNALVDATTVAAILALIAVLAGRLADPVKRLLSGAGDWLAWALTLVPLVTGYAAYHHLLHNYTLLLALHVLSVDLLLALLPFTTLFHAVGLFLARWYGGDIAARKGVAT